MTVAQSVDTLTITTTDRQGAPERIQLKLDGSAKTVSTSQSGGTVSEGVMSAEWKADQLVLSFQTHSNRLGPYTITQTWSLKDGLLVTNDVMTGATGEPIGEPGKTTYRKS